jgi:hypothetical protein
MATLISRKGTKDRVQETHTRPLTCDDTTHRGQLPALDGKIEDLAQTVEALGRRP